MAGPTLAGKVTLDDSQAVAALRRVGIAAAAAAAKLQAGAGGALAKLANIASSGGAAAATAFVVAAAAAGAAAVAFGRAQASIFEAGRSLQVLSRQTGAGTDGLAVLQSKFAEAGLDADQVGGALARLQKSIAGVEDLENKGGPKALQSLGFNLAQLQKMKPDQQLLAVGAAISRIADPAERSATAMKIFSKTGYELGALFNGDFAKISPNMALNAQILARNSALFEEVSIKLGRASEIGRSFFLGAGAGMAKVLGPVLDQINRLNLVAVGAKFGQTLAAAGEIMVGIFTYPRAAIHTLGQLLQAYLRQEVNVLVAGFKFAGDYLGGIVGVVGPAFQQVFTAVGGLLSGIAEQFAGKLMQAPRGLLLMLGAGFEYITGTLPGQLLAGLKTALEYLQAGFRYVADMLTGDTVKGLLSAALKFQQAIVSPSATIAQMLADQITDGGKKGFGDILKEVQASGVFKAIANPAQTFGAARQKAIDSMSSGIEGMANSGSALELHGDTRITAALEEFAKVGTTLPANLKAAFTNVPGFKVNDVAGAGTYANRAAAGLGALQGAGAAVLGVGAKPTGVPSWQVAEANRITMAEHLRNVGNAIGGSGLMGAPAGGARDVGWGSGGLVSGAAALRQWNSTHGRLGGGGDGKNTVSAPDVVTALQTQIADLKTHLTSLLGD